MRTAFITHVDCLKHVMIAGHPECPKRLTAIQDQLVSSAGLFDFLHHYEAPKATIEQLARVHTTSYIESLLDRVPTEGLVRIDPDTFMNAYTITAALRAAGAVVMATELVCRGEVENAFCSIRPPGHHAERDKAMGFCFFNNVAVGTAHALDVLGLNRVAIVDFDVHHGNGTENIFENDNRVLVCSSYQHPLYPFSGRDTVPGHLINVPLAAGTWGKQFREAIDAHWLPALEAFQPEMIFISAGFDGHIEDGMADLNLVESDFAWVTQAVLQIAASHAAGRVVSVLEGGYALSALGRSVVAHIRVLLGI